MISFLIILYIFFPQFSVSLEMSPYIFFAIYIAVCLIYLISMRKSVELGNRVIFKALPIGLLIGTCVKYLEESRVLVIKNPDFLPRIYTLTGALIFFCMSNVYSEFTSLTMYGISSYIIALSIYIYGYSSGFKLFADLDTNDIMVFVAVFLISGLVYFYLFPRLSYMLAIFVAVYMICDSLFLVTQILLVIKKPMSLMYLGVSGAVGLYVTDIIQGIHVWRCQIPHAQVVVMTMYYVSQLLITSGTLLVAS